MTMQEIHIRDPFILAEGGRYYLYGSRAGRTSGPDAGFDAYVSDDLVDWSGPVEVFRRPANFWADKHFWAPEVHRWKGAYYMLASFKSETACRGTQILRAESPLGPFVPHSDGPVTPKDWECLDGTLYISPQGRPYMVFCHEWLQVHDGEMCAVPLTEDLSAPAGEPWLLFRASEPDWIAKDRTDYVTDGPYLYRTREGALLMLWSTFANDDYCECIARSDNGDITGHWRHEKPLFTQDGGHGMIFRTHDGQLRFICHQPNQFPHERPRLTGLLEQEGMLFIE